MRSKAKVWIVLIMILLLIFFSDTTKASVQKTLALSANVLIPSLFPFIILSGILCDFGIDLIMPPVYCAYFISILCGFPIGTRAVCDYYASGKLSKPQANRLLLCTCNASPAFLVIAIGKIMLGNTKLGYLLLLSSVLYSLLLFICLVPKHQTNRFSTIQTISVIESLIKNTSNAVLQMFFICSITIVFGLICDFICKFIPVPNQIRPFIIGSIELMHGIDLFSNEPIWLIGAMVGFSGICIWIQCARFVLKTDLSISFLIIGKLLGCVLIPLIFSLIHYNIWHIFSIFSVIFLFILTKQLKICIIKKKGRSEI